ncbi:hypothetical protein GCM10027595_23790 [Corynebacterium nasicanis]
MAGLAGRVAARLGRPVAVHRATGSVVEVEGETHLIPLFVTEALLLDRLLTPGVSADPPLGAALADIVAARHRAALT